MNLAKDEIEGSLQQGFMQVWEVAEDYEIVEGILRTKGEMKRRYAPIMRHELPTVLCKLRRGDEAGLLQFARMYGTFGYSHLVPPAERCGGDPLPWIWAHVTTIQMCQSLLRWLREDDLNRLEVELRNLQLPEPIRAAVGRFLFMRDDRAHWPATTVAERGKIVYRSWRALGAHTEQRFFEEGQLEGLAEEVVRSVIRANIAGISAEPILVQMDKRQVVRTGFHFGALIEIVYWHLNNALQRGRLWICEYAPCGAFFLQQRRGQLYCPPPYGHHGKSRCATAARQARFQAPEGRGARMLAQDG